MIRMPVISSMHGLWLACFIEWVLVLVWVSCRFGLLFNGFCFCCDVYYDRVVLYLIDSMV